MSDTNQPRTLPGPREVDIAKIVLRKVIGDEGGVSVPLRLPEGRPEVWVMVNRRRLLIFSRGLKVKLIKPHPYCRRCVEAIEKMHCPETQEGLADLLHEVINTIQNCNCTQPTPAAAAIISAEQLQQSQRISAPGQRVKVISTGEPTPTASGTKETIRVSKSKSVTGVEDSRGPSEEGRAEKFTAPSIRFRPISNAQVEVTIPRYVCEALVRHCSESNYHKREVGGVMVGYQEEAVDESSGHRIYTNVVTDLIHFKPSDSSGSHLCLDGNSWVHISNIYEERYQPWKKVRLGWYHTHPTQGIFFSPLDHDFHTNFNQPFQFAVVVNPRTMEAGLVYWKNYESRLTEEPIFFSLKRRTEMTQAGGGGNTPSDPVEGESPPIAWVRILFFALITGLICTYVATHSRLFSVSPGDACLLAFNVLVGLRLMNAKFFRPAERVEDRFRVALGEWWWRALGKVAFALDRYPMLGYALVLGIFLLAMLLMFRVLWWQPHAVAPASEEMGSQSGPVSELPSASQRRGPARLHLNLFYSGRELSVFADEGTQRVTFRKAPNGQWEPLNLGDEKIFLRSVLEIDVRSNQASDDVRLLQQRLYRKGGKENEADGFWGPQIRNALLDELMQLQSQGGEWAIPSPGGQPRLVVVMGTRRTE
jgi:proteasome lid subunit RPN8/RPN11